MLIPFALVLCLQICPPSLAVGLWLVALLVDVGILYIYNPPLASLSWTRMHVLLS